MHGDKNVGEIDQFKVPLQCAEWLISGVRPQTPEHCHSRKRSASGIPLKQLSKRFRTSRNDRKADFIDRPYLARLNPLQKPQTEEYQKRPAAKEEEPVSPVPDSFSPFGYESQAHGLFPFLLRIVTD